MDSNFSGLYVLAGAVVLALSFAVVFAQLKLFSIDRTLRAILVELRGGPEAAAATEAKAKARQVLERYQVS